MMKFAWSIVGVALVGVSAMAFEDAKAEKCDNASFVKKASCGNLTEIKMGELARENATSSDVKAFAAMMVKAHTKAQGELKEACKASKTECPTEQTKEGKAACEKCEKLKGEKDFDSKYIAMQVECHQKALKLYEKAAKECECKDLQAYAEKTIPEIKKHLKMAQDIKKSVAGTASR